MAGVRLEFAQFGHFDYFNIYRNSVSTAIENLGEPIGSSSTMYYKDLTVESNQDYYYRAGVVRNSIEEFSGEFHVKTVVEFDPPYNLIVEFKNDETNRLELNWKLDGFVDEQRYYCSEVPINPENLPVPRAILAGDVRTYIDTAIEVGKTYYVAVGAVKNGVEKLSEEIIVVASQFTTVALLKFDGNLNDETGKFYASVGNTSFGSDTNGQYAIFSGNYIYTNHSNDFDFASDFKIEVEASFLSIPGNSASALLGTYLNNDGWVFQFRNDEGKGDRLRFSIGDSTYADFAFTPTLNQLYRFKVERLDGYIVCKVDDVQIGSSVYLPNNTESNVSSTLNIGVLKYISSAIQVFNGHIYKIQIDKRIN